MKLDCQMCKTKVDVVQDQAELLHLDTEMVNTDEIDYAVEYQLHQDDTVTNLRREPNSRVKKVRVEHRWLCPAQVTVAASYLLPPRLRKLIDSRAKEFVKGTE